MAIGVADDLPFLRADFSALLGWLGEAAGFFLGVPSSIRIIDTRLGCKAGEAVVEDATLVKLSWIARAAFFEGVDGFLAGLAFSIMFDRMEDAGLAGTGSLLGVEAID